MQSKQKHKVKIYTTQWCAYCNAAKRFFRENDIQFEEVDVEKNARARAEMLRKSGQMGVPVIDIDNIIIVGFDRHAIEHALGMHAHHH